MFQFIYLDLKKSCTSKSLVSRNYPYKLLKCRNSYLMYFIFNYKYTQVHQYLQYLTAKISIMGTCILAALLSNMIF